MIYKGPNTETLFTQKIDMNYEKEGNYKCIQEFNIDDGMRCVLILLSGMLHMRNCLFSLNGAAPHMTEKIPCIACFPDTSCEIKNCCFFGDSYNEVITCGVFTVEPKSMLINDSVFKDHLGGGIIASLEEESEFKAFNNKIMNCKIAGIYVQGEDSKPQLE